MSELEVKKSQTDVTKKIVWVIAILMSVSTIYNLGFAPMETWTYRILYVSFCVIIISLTKGIATKYKPLNAAVNWLVVALMVGTSLYLVLNLNRLIMEIQFAPTQMDVVICCIGVFLVLLATYETNGLVITLLAGIFQT